MKIVNGKIDWSADKSEPITRDAEYYDVSDETKAAIKRNVAIHGEERRSMITDALCWAEKIWQQRDKNEPLDPDALIADLVERSSTRR
ncbi:hypothetical protein M0R72_13995 [Candidatus Pacearchaeota archaeon]|jgi:hypothetical protein|nr:hypothetical protein [Candidatus Pacearchaeota archaeon]